LVLLHGVARSHVYDAVHSRRIVAVGEDYWIVSDWLDAPGEHDYALHFQLGEEAQDAVKLTRDGGPLACSPGLLVAQPPDVRVRAAVEESFVSHRYGEKLAAPRLRFDARGSHVAFDTVLMPWRTSPPPLYLVRPRVQHLSGGRCGALRIESIRGEEAFSDLWIHCRAAGNGRCRIGEWEFSGRWLWLREDANGRVLRVHGDATARLLRSGVPAALDGSSS
jgi:hypothetical protein